MKKTKIVSVMVCLAMIATLFVASPAAFAKKKATKPLQVKSVTSYGKNGKKWSARKRHEYKYDKYGHVIRYRVVVSSTGEVIDTTTYKHKYKKKKIVSTKFTSTWGDKTTVTYNKNQLPIKIASTDGVTKYKFKNGYVSEEKSSGEVTLKYKITTKKGKLTKRIYKDTDSGLTIIETYNKKGLIIKSVSKQGKKVTGQTKYKYTYYKNGLAKSVIRMGKSSGDKKYVSWDKHTFKYTKKKASVRDYTSAINYRLTDSFLNGAF